MWSEALIAQHLVRARIVLQRIQRIRSEVRCNQCFKGSLRFMWTTPIDPRGVNSLGGVNADNNSLSMRASAWLVSYTDGELY